MALLSRNRRRQAARPAIVRWEGGDSRFLDRRQRQPKGLRRCQHSFPQGNGDRKWLCGIAGFLWGFSPGSRIIRSF